MNNILACDVQDTAIIRSIVNPIGDIRGVINNSASITGIVAVSSIDIRPETYHGDYYVTPKTDTETILETAGFLLEDNVVVSKIPYYETSNPKDGYTVYIGSEV